MGTIYQIIILICEILQERENTDDNTYTVYLQQKIIGTFNNMSCEEPQNIYRRIIRQPHVLEI